MKLDLKQPKYIIPLLALPFFFLFFYVWHSSASPPKLQKQSAVMNTSVGDVSDDIKKKELTDKLDAYRDTYKDADGQTAVAPVPIDHTVDSLRQLLNPPPKPAVSQNDKAMIEALNRIRQPRPQPTTDPPEPKEKDPMQLFKQQMAYMDSVQQNHNPTKPKHKADTLRQKALAVHKASDSLSNFNTVTPDKHSTPITAAIDENITGFAGSRLRLRLLEDIIAGKTLIVKGTYLYALVSGFSEQRVTFRVKSILYDGKILPVKLELYDLDGLPGLYVPSSAFRDFTKDASTNTVQGIDIESSSTSFLMSSADKLFQSTSSAIAGIIRKDKAKLKYNSFIYLINNDQ